MKKTKPKNNPKKAIPRKPVTVYSVIRVILIALVCLVLILGIVGRIFHYINNH